MDIKLTIFAGLAFALAIVFLWLQRRAGRQQELMAATPTSRAADVPGLAPGTLVEVKGTLRCASPLTADFSGQSCAYFKAETYEDRTEYRTNSDGRRERHTTSYLVSSNSRSAPCVVEDASGGVTLKLEGAEVEGEQVFNRTEQGAGGVLGTIANVVGGGHSQCRRTETILAHEIPIYVLGEVQPDHSLGKPLTGSKNGTFIVSRHSEEERSQQIAGSMQWYHWLAIGCAVIGVLLLIWARASAPA